MRAIINGISDGLVNIYSQVNNTAEAVIEKAGMIPWTKGTKLSGKFLGSFYWADKLMTPAVLSFVVILTAREHFKASDADRDTGAGQFEGKCSVNAVIPAEAGIQDK